jgi:hypothetical protein
MNRITHQSPRQRGYGSTSSLRNDSLKHTRKHEKGGRNRTKKKSTQALADRPARRGGPSALATRTVRQCTADCPHRYGGPSGLGRGLSVKTNKTTRNEPRKRTVRGEHADCPPGTRGPSACCCGPSETSSNQNSKSRRIETKGEQEHEEHLTNTCGADRPPGRRGPSARHGHSRKTARPRRSTPPNHHRISQTFEAVETRVWGLEKRHTRML